MNQLQKIVFVSINLLYTCKYEYPDGNKFGDIVGEPKNPYTIDDKNAGFLQQQLNRNKCIKCNPDMFREWKM